jgi:DHA2 family multidrug resistance protein
MEVLDTTIANVALRYIAGGLSAAVTDSEWVITSYLAANAIILPMSGWLAAHLGRRNYFLLSIAIFTISSGLCGMATSLGQLIFFRVMQGLAGGGLQPSSQAILLDSFPPEKQGAAQTLFGVAALLAPVVGPTLGGYITDQYSWRWIFYINVPVGALALFLCWLMVQDPEYLREHRKELKKQRPNFDFIGLSLLVLTIVCWEVVLSKGQEWDWLNDAFGRVQVLLALFLIAGASLVFWEMRHASPIVNFRPLRDRNFAISSLIIFLAFAVLYGTSTLLPALLESLFGYDAFHAGLVLSPSGVSAILALIVVGALLGRRLDARWLIAAGLLILAAGNFWMSQLNLDISPWQAVWPRVVMIAGLGMIFAPLNVAAYLYIPLTLRGAAVGLFALLRNEGGSFGTSMGQTIVERREIFHALRLNEDLDRLNPAVHSYFGQVQPEFLQQTGDPAASHRMALRSLEDLREQQALALAYFDAFLIFAVVAVVLAFLVLLMKRSVAEKRAHPAAE